MTGAVDFSFLAHPAFSLFEPVIRERLTALGRLPAPSELRDLGRGIPNTRPPWFDFTLQDSQALRAVGGYDRSIALSALIPSRAGSFHDLLGALVWLHFPELKTAIHRLHLAGDSARRGAAENAATHLDESGVLVVSSDTAVFEALAALEWSQVFWLQRATLLHSTRFFGFGHGLLDALREPHPRLMGKALFVRVSSERLELDASSLRVFLDSALAPRLASFLLGPALLQPLPVLGVPGWSPQQSSAFYRDTHYFREARQRPRTGPGPSWLDLELGPAEAAHSANAGERLP